jgi:acyl-CoA synthetase (AMP-forming)/AMP-acid ligase II
VHEDLGQSVHAVIETDNDGFTVEQLGAFLADYLARPKQPRSIAIQHSPVRDDAGKFRKPAAAPIT